MSSVAFTPDLRDLQFVLFEQIRVQDLADPRFAEFGQELYDAVITEAARVGTEVLAPINSKGDRHGCRLEDGVVTTPPGFKEAWKSFVEGGWTSLTAPPEWGGQGLPSAIALAAVEIFTGANTAFSMYPGLTVGAANLLRERGTDAMKATYLPNLVSGKWTGTMCLTEPGAGSAVGDAKTVAVRDGDSYLLTGTKIFISAGEHDMAENIIHLMLARTPDAPAGIKGISLFVVPKFLVNEDGSLGARNDVVCAGIEHKMGINGNATCMLSMGEGGGARGFIVGREGEGIQHMFVMMNEARIGVGTQGYAVASAACNAALAYARDRVQGTSLKDMRDANARRVAIIEHPDVRRMLLGMRAKVAGMRALTVSLAHRFDLTHGKEKDESAQADMDWLEVLTPICKSWCTDEGFQICKDAVQVMGGYGYIGEYPVEQYLRDSKVFSIYEGTNHIQALDLIGRKMAAKGGMRFMSVLNELNIRIAALEEFPELAAEKDALEKSRDRLGDSAMHLGGLGMSGDEQLPALHANDMLNLFGDVVIGVLLADQARIAMPKLKAMAAAAGVDLMDARARAGWLADSAEARFYAGKVDNLRFYCAQHLPRTVALRAAIKSTDRSALEAVL
jgi:alkylation response protein AidB-like acyl-CoA dehydrogenase